MEYITGKVLLDAKEISMMNPVITVKKSAGDHTRVTVQGIVHAGSHPYIASIQSMADVQIQVCETNENLFYGVLTYMDIRIRGPEGRQEQELYLEAMSETCRMDQKKEYRAFQKKSASYQEILDITLKEYPGINYIFGPEAAGKTIGRFAVQYEETDWEFLSRMSSCLHIPLIASHKTKGVKFTMGVVWKKEAYEIPPDDERQIEIIHDAFWGMDKSNEIPQGGHQYLKWRIDHPDTPFFEIGDCILYKGAQCYVKEAALVIKDHTVKQSCLLGSRQGFYVPETENPFLTGLSLPGAVKEVKNNQLKVSLDIDSFTEQDCWFVYSTFYAMFYCMPEKGDRVNLYFPDHREDHAFVLNSVRTDPQEAAAAGADATAGAAGGAKGGISSTGPENMQSGQDTVGRIDAAPYLAMLSAPEYGQLVNANVVLANNPSFSDADASAQGGNGRETGGGTAAAASSGSGGAVRKDYDFQSMAQNEKVKVLCTKDGRMVVLDDDSGNVSIVCSNGTYIALEEKGISIITNERIAFNASNEIKIKAGAELYLSAEDNIRLVCKESCIGLTPERIAIKGLNIKLNEE